MFATQKGQVSLVVCSQNDECPGVVNSLCSLAVIPDPKLRWQILHAYRVIIKDRASLITSFPRFFLHKNASNFRNHQDFWMEKGETGGMGT